MVHVNSVSELIRQANERQTAISDVVLSYQMQGSGDSEEGILRELSVSLRVMREAVQQGREAPLKSVSGISGGNAFKLGQAADEGRMFSGGFLSDVIANALAVSEVNAAMGRIVAAPTAGACGILPGCLMAMEKHHGMSEKQLVAALLNAAGIGMVIAQNASISGARGGCQAECGTAAAMAASALTQLMGGTPEQCGDACAHGLKSLLGLVCDPVAGLVEEPCGIRNVSSAAVAIASAELALAGVQSIIPADEVIAAMNEVGRMMPSCLRETAQGGLATSPTGQEISRRLFGEKK